MNKKDENQEVEIDLMQLFRAMARKAWAIALAAVIFGGIALSYTKFLVTPLYKARTLLYVNNSSISVGSAHLSISSGDLSAAQQLVDTYTVILKTRATLEEVIDRAALPYSYEQLCNMISSASMNGTEIFYIDVTSPDPKEAELIANTISVVLPEKIAGIVEGSSVRIVDYAVEPAHKASPSLGKNTMMGVLLGIVVSCAVIVVMELMDSQIHNSDYLMQNYDIPVLAVVPDLVASKTNANSYEGYGGYGHADHRQKGGKKNG